MKIHSIIIVKVRIESGEKIYKNSWKYTLDKAIQFSVFFTVTVSALILLVF